MAGKKKKVKTNALPQNIKNPAVIDAIEKMQANANPVSQNALNEALKNLTFTVTNRADDREMGTAVLETLEAGESRLVPVLTIARKSDFDDLGVVSVHVRITDSDENELEKIPVDIQIQENLGLTIQAEGQNADKLKILDMKELILQA